MDDPLRVYLHDHLAGSGFAIELLETLEKRYPEHETGALASALLKEVREDRDTLERIIDQVGKSHIDWKEATAWLGEKASRAKLQHHDPQGLGAFEALETVALGISGKLALWRVLPQIAQLDSRVAGHDFVALATRAQNQFAKIEDYRLRLARSTFTRAPS